MLEHTGFYLSIEIGKKSKILNALFKAHDLINGVMIKMPFWLAESIEAINEIKSIVKEKRVLVDLRLGGYSAEDIRYFSSMIGDQGADGFTIMGFYPEGVICSYVRSTTLSVFSILDVGLPNYEKSFPDDVLLEATKVAKLCGCKGIVMTSMRTERIAKARQIVGRDLEILASLDGKAKPGEGVKSGADFEIIPQRLWFTDKPREAVQAIAESILKKRRE
jgi:orotidine-5'-phosphate decarboxylase